MAVVNSTRVNHGKWEGQHSSWNGCVCGDVHPYPIDVFWIQCDGPCEAWYNVRAECARLDSRDAAQLNSWYCRVCYKRQLDNPVICAFSNLPDHLIYHILEFAASATSKIRIMRKLSLTCKHLNHAVENRPWNGVWGIFLQRDFHRNGERQSRSKRARRHHSQPILTCKAQTEELYADLCQKTEDAHMSLHAMLDSDQTSLSLVRLRGLMNGRVLVNRRSQAGRTFIQECCTADYVDARVVLQCVRELLDVHGANPNMLTKGEKDGDRPALFFAISRLMPTLVEALLIAGASREAKVKGRFRLVSDPSATIDGAFTPLEFAEKLKEAESTRQGPSSLSSYWTRMLHECVKLLSTQSRKE